MVRYSVFVLHKNYRFWQMKKKLHWSFFNVMKIWIWCLVKQSVGDVDHGSARGRILKKGLASYCKAETTFTFYFTILPLSRAFLSINNREMKSESGFSFAMASQPFQKALSHHSCCLLRSDFGHRLQFWEGRPQWAYHTCPKVIQGASKKTSFSESWSWQILLLTVRNPYWTFANTS